MSLNTIKFDTTDIALLYKNSLVEINEEKQVLQKTNSIAEKLISESDPGEWHYLGENKKNTLVVVKYKEAVYLPDKQMSFLTKLLAACNLNLADVAILNFHNYKSSDFDKIINYFKPKVVLLFDIEPGEFGMPMIFPQFQVQGHKDALFVFAPSLGIIEPDKTLKGKLWTSLKKIFNL